MDIAPVITPGTTAPAADATGAGAAVPTAPGQAFSDLFAVALGGTEVPAPVTAVIPATAVVTLPVTPAASNPASVTTDVPADAVAATPVRVAVQGDALPSSVTDPPESPPEIPSTSRKDAQATAPNAPATRLDQPENQEVKTDPKTNQVPVDQTAAAIVAATAQASAVQVPNPTLPIASAPEVEVPSEPKATTLVATSPSQTPAPPTTDNSDSAAQNLVKQSLVTQGTTAPAVAPPVVSGPVTATPSPNEKTVKMSASGSRESAKSRSAKASQSSPVDATQAADQTSDPLTPETTSTGDLDAPAMSERVADVSVSLTVASDKTALPKETSDAPKLDAAPDLGVVPVVTVAAVAEPAKSPDKAAAKTIESTDNIAIGSTAIKAPEIKTPETKVAEKNSDSTFAEVLVETAVKGDKDSADGGDQTSKDQPTADPAPVASTAVRSSATDRPEAGTDRPEVDRHLVVRQVADRIENMVASRPRDGVTIHLEPRDLGTVTLVVKGLSSALDVQVSASDTRVRAGLEASRNDLAQALAPRGIELRDVRIVTAASSGSGTGPGSKDGGANSNPDGRPRQQASNSSQTGFTQSSTRTARSTGSRGSRRTGGVDLLV